MRTRAQLLTFLLLLFSIAQCSGEKGLSSKVTFASRDKEPVIILGDRSVIMNGTPTTIKAPWFTWQYSITNNTDKNLYVATVMFKFRTRVNGLITTGETTLDPNASCTGTENRTSLAYVRPGTTFTGLDATSCDVDNVVNHLPATEFETWYIHGLEENSDNNSFTMELEAIGWFTDPSTGKILERFSGYDYLISR